MKIWITIAYDPIPEVDVGRRILRYGGLAERLQATGHDVTLWTSDFDHVTKKHRKTPAKQIKLSSGVSVQFLRGCAYDKNITLRRIAHNQLIAREFSAFAQNRAKPDLVFAGLPCLELTEATIDYGIAQKIPTIIDIQDIWPDVYLNAFPDYLHKAARLLLFWEYMRAHWTLRSASGITAVSRTYLKWALRTAGRSIQYADGVFPLGCENRREQAAGQYSIAHLCEQFRLPPNRTYVIYIGQFAASYDLLTVVKAARMLHERGDTNIHLIMAGDGEKSAVLKENARDLPNITFPGWLDQKSIVALLSVGDIGLAPYVANASQSLPYKPFEYMEAALAIVSSLCGELATVLQANDAGLHYTAGDATGLAWTLKELAADRSRCRAMGERARRVYELNYNTDVIQKKLIKHLEGIPAHFGKS